MILNIDFYVSSDWKSFVVQSEAQSASGSQIRPSTSQLKDMSIYELANF